MWIGSIRLVAPAAILALSAGSLLGQDTDIAATVASQDSRLELFLGVAGPEGGVYHTWQTTPESGNGPSAWAPWLRYGPAPDITGGLVAFRDPGGRVAVAWLSGGSIWIAAAGSAGASLAEPKRLDTHDLRSLTIASDQDGRNEFLALDASGSAWSVAQTAIGSWESLNVHTLGGHDLRSIAASPFRDGRIAVVALGADGRVYWTSQNGPNAGWGAWSGLQGEGMAGVAAAANADGRLQVVALGGDRHLYQRYETSPGIWSAWEFLAKGPLEAPITVAMNQDGRLEVFAREQGSGVVKHLWQAAPNAAWVDISHFSSANQEFMDDQTATSFSGGRLALVTASRARCTVDVVSQAQANGVTGWMDYQPIASPCPPPSDFDVDGVSDAAEDQLLATFRPYYRFSLDGGADQYHPTDALWYLRNSSLVDADETGDAVLVTQPRLASDPSLALKVNDPTFGPSDVRSLPKKMPYQLDPLTPVLTGEPDWQKVRNEAVGLYGHVTPLRDPPQSGQITGYKIEYWQFYGFNDAPTRDYRHEGDWESVQLIVEANGTTVRRVIHEAHGEPIGFDIAGAKRVDLGGGFVEYQGSNYGTLFWGPSGSGRAQNNLVRLYCTDGVCTHPVVYIEHSGHATWPSAQWGWVGARKHGGDGDAYLVATPPNLGEIDHANPKLPAADLILHYNGHWGEQNDGPEGPSLHGSWGH
jgi:hypothetical protein